MLDFFWVPKSVENNVRTPLCQFMRDSQSYTTCRARDECDFVSEFHGDDSFDILVLQ